MFKFDHLFTVLILVFLFTSKAALACDPPCPADVNGDGAADIADYTIVLAASGSCPKPSQPCPADINGNGYVGVIDAYIAQGMLSAGFCVCRADFNRDGMVDNEDYSILQKTFFNDCRADLDFNGVIDKRDAEIVLLSVCGDKDADPRADLDGDRDVDIDDLDFVYNQMGTSCIADLNLDGFVDIADYTLWLGCVGSCL